MANFFRDHTLSFYEMCDCKTWPRDLGQRIRKRVEEIGGWIKTIGGFRKTRFKGILRTQLAGWFVGAAYNLLRMAKLKALEVKA